MRNYRHMYSRDDSSRCVDWEEIQHMVNFVEFINPLFTCWRTTERSWIKTMDRLNVLTDNWIGFLNMARYRQVLASQMGVYPNTTYGRLCLYCWQKKKKMAKFGHNIEISLFSHYKDGIEHQMLLWALQVSSLWLKDNLSTKNLMDWLPFGEGFGPLIVSEYKNDRWKNVKVI